jgi:hypothetical protein
VICFAAGNDGTDDNGDGTVDPDRSSHRAYASRRKASAPEIQHRDLRAVQPAGVDRALSQVRVDEPAGVYRPSARTGISKLPAPFQTVEQRRTTSSMASRSPCGTANAHSGPRTWRAQSGSPDSSSRQPCPRGCRGPGVAPSSARNPTVSVCRHSGSRDADEPLHDRQRSFGSAAGQDTLDDDRPRRDAPLLRLLSPVRKVAASRSSAR